MKRFSKGYGHGLNQARQPLASAGRDRWKSLAHVHAEHNSLREKLRRFDESQAGRWLRRVSWLLLVAAAGCILFVLPTPF